MRDASVCYCVSEEALRVARRDLGIADERLRLLPLGANTDLYHPPTEPNHATERRAERERLGIRDEETVLLYTGRLTNEKDPMLIAKAAELLRRTGAEVRLVCVGEGSQERTLRTFPFVHVMGPVSQVRLAMLFRAADVAIWPRSMSSSQIDGLASGLPIVVSHKVGKPELFECGALSYHEGDAAALAEAVRPLLDPNVRARLGADAARIVRSKYSWDQVAEQRLNDYYAALAGAGTL
jgi:glycosyltransferase involved in cell wall biosynthesis